jgi:steroid delta-isomerase-like uncharacterized protein
MATAEIFKKHMDTLIKQDWNAFRKGLADDAVYEEEATQRRLQGADEYVKAIKVWLTAFPDMKVKIKDTVVSGDSVVAELEWEGTHKAPLSGPMGTLPATGKSAKVRAMLAMRYDGDKIREARHYFDLMTLLTQLGVLPQRPATQPPTP